MDKKRVPKGLFGSIGLHLVMMLIPLSTTVQWKSDEVELFVLDEKPVILKDIIKRPKTPTVSRAPEQELRKGSNLPLMPPVAQEESSMEQTPIETVKEVIEEPQEETLKMTEPPVATEPSVTFSEPISEASTKSQPPPPSQAVVPLVVARTADTTLPITGSPKSFDATAKTETSSTESSRSSPVDVPFGSDVAPRFLHREIPIYPLWARRLGKEGRVLLRLTIDETGALLAIDVIEGAGFGFTEAAVEAVKKSTFLPAKKDGKPVASRALLPIRFRLERN